MVPKMVVVETDVPVAELIVNVREVEVPPPGVGLKTVTAAVPAFAISAADTAAVSRVPFTKVVVRAVPFHLTVELLMKFVPLSVSVNAEPPAVAELGAILDKPGTGFCGGPTELMVKVCVDEVPPPGAGLKTMTAAVPVEARALAGISVLSVEPLTNVVVPITAPFQRTVELEMKLDPVSVSVTAGLPTVAELGEMLDKPGTGFCGGPAVLMVKV